MHSDSRRVLGVLAFLTSACPATHRAPHEIDVDTAGGAGAGTGAEAEAEGNWVVVAVCIFTTIGGVVFGFDTGIIGGVIVLDGFRDTMDLPRIVKGEASLTHDVLSLFKWCNIARLFTKWRQIW